MTSWDCRPEHVGDDLLGLGGVLGAALHEHLSALVDEGERGVGLEVEVLLAGHLGDAAEHVGGAGEALLDVTARDDGLAALEALRLDRLGQRHDRGQLLVVDLDGGRAQPGGLERLPQHPADGVPDEHHDLGEERLVVLDAGVVDARHVVGGEHADHPGDRQCGLGVDAGDPGVRVRRADRVRVQRSGRPDDEVVGVERVAGDVQRRALVGQREPDDGVVGPVGQPAHRDAPVDSVVPPGPQGVAEHRGAVRRARPLVVDRGALSCQDRGRLLDGVEGPRPTFQRRLGGARPERCGRDAAEADPGPGDGAVDDVEGDADGDAGDVVEAPLGDLVEGGVRRERRAGSARCGSARRGAARSRGSR